MKFRHLVSFTLMPFDVSVILLIAAKGLASRSMFFVLEL